MAKTATATELQKAGKVAYDAKKYDEALDAFSKALVLARKSSPSDVSLLLDQRVAVHVKLENLPLARKDATSMIRANKSDGRGYLRCGQLDRLEENSSAALRWYEHGLKQVPKADRLYGVIDAQREKTKALLNLQLMSDKSRDPILTLPAELVEIVMAHLEYLDIVKCLRVSKAWRTTLSRLRPLVDTVDFSDARKMINYKMMLAALKRLGANPRVLIMKGLMEPATDLLRLNLERWRNYTQLEQLNISSLLFGSSYTSELKLLPFGKYSLKSLTIKDGRIRGETVVEVIRACKTLEYACLSNIYGVIGSYDNVSFPTVRTLKLGGDNSSSHSFNINPNFFSYLPNLHQLECHDLRINQEKDTHFDLSACSLRKLKCYSCEIPWWPKLPSTIEVWDNYHVKTFLRINGQSPKLGELSKLRFLRFHKTSSPPSADSFLPDRATRSITHLDTRGSSLSLYEANSFDPHDPVRCGHLVNLRELAMGGLEDDLAVVEALGYLRKLEVLSLIGSKISGALFIGIIKNCRECLRQVTLIDCPDVSAETINWAREQGISMLVRKS